LNSIARRTPRRDPLKSGSLKSIIWILSNRASASTGVTSSIYPRISEASWNWRKWRASSILRVRKCLIPSVCDLQSANRFSFFFFKTYPLPLHLRLRQSCACASFNLAMRLSSDWVIFLGIGKLNLLAINAIGARPLDTMIWPRSSTLHRAHRTTSWR
jgi:hypothetical protein